MKVLISFIIAFIIPILLTPFFIKIQKKYRIGQRIRKEGPDLHQHKSGTPTMGGLIIYMAVTVALLFFQSQDINVYVIFFLLISFGIVGFLDDFIKNYKERSLGLKARTKILLQLIICMLFLYWHSQHGPFNQNILIPFLQKSFYLQKIFYMPFVILVFISATNAVNLTDGLDGLATGLMIIALLAFAVIAFFQKQTEIAFFVIILVSACAGFLIFNYHPAKIFLGDVGSLGLGGALAGIAVLTGTELYLLLIGGVFVTETLSVIIQVLSIRYRKKPIFRMSPVHHHFELLKWREKKIVSLFWGTGVILAILGIIAYPFS